MEVCKTVEKHHIDKDTLYKSIGLLHQYNIVHQDIKPNNIMFSPAYHKIVLIDYGLSKFIK